MEIEPLENGAHACMHGLLSIKYTHTNLQTAQSIVEYNVADPTRLAWWNISCMIGVEVPDFPL